MNRFQNSIKEKESTLSSLRNSLKSEPCVVKKDFFVYENQRWWIGKGFSNNLLMNGKFFKFDWFRNP